MLMRVIINRSVFYDAPLSKQIKADMLFELVVIKHYKGRDMVMKKMNTNNKGFSLVELMIVVAIIGLLAAIGVPQYAKFQARARQSEAKAALGALYTAEQSFFQEWNQYTVDLRNAGFGVTGVNLRYKTGFSQNACTGYSAATAPAEVAANNNSTVAAVSPGASFTAAATTPALPGATACSTAAFTGYSVGDPKNTPLTTGADQWSMTELKALRNVAVGL